MCQFFFDGHFYDIFLQHTIANQTGIHGSEALYREISKPLQIFIDISRIAQMEDSAVGLLLLQ
jgi:hypothetical protein